MSHVTIPVKWLNELLDLCGPEDHELRERVMKSAAPAAPEEAAGKAHDWRDNASYGGETCAECGAVKGSRRGNAPCAWPPEPLDVCTDPYNCARCKAHPNHRKGLEHAGISRPRSAAQAKEGGEPA